MKEIDRITVAELDEMARGMYGDLVKADIDVLHGRVVVDMELHADGEAYLLETGSKQEDIWGINLHPAKFGTDEFIEYDSVINLRPRQGNLSRDVNNPSVRARIAEIIAQVIRP